MLILKDRIDQHRIHPQEEISVITTLLTNEVDAVANPETKLKVTLLGSKALPHTGLG